MNNKGNQKTLSRLGIISLGIGFINIGIFVYIIYRIGGFLLSQSELMKNPLLISGMRIEQFTYNLFFGFLVLQIIGLILGLLGLFDSNARKLIPLLGTCLNGLFVLTTAMKIGIF